MSEINREEWLKARKTCIGGSDVAAILGESPYKNALDVYLSKASEEPSEEDKDHLAFGRDVEGAIANLYAKRTFRTVTDEGATIIKRHPQYPFLGATLDRMTSHEDRDTIGPLELKHVGGFQRLDEWADEPPLHYQLQLQFQMFCTGSTWGCLAGMFPGYQLVWRDFEYDAELIESILPLLIDFWGRVERRDPPEPTGKTALDSVKKLFQIDHGTTIELGTDTENHATDLISVKDTIKTLEARKEELEAKIRFAIGDAEAARFPGGGVATLKTTTRKGYVREVKASTYRTLRLKGIS